MAMGKSTISMVIFNSYIDITRGYHICTKWLPPPYRSMTAPPRWCPASAQRAPVPSWNHPSPGAEPLHRGRWRKPWPWRSNFWPWRNWRKAKIRQLSFFSGFCNHGISWYFLSQLRFWVKAMGFLTSVQI